ncbi:amino acid permease, partial [Streptomyces sp. NPDC004290]
MQHGFQGLRDAHFAPTTGGFLALVPILLFAYVGFEAPNAAGEEMHDPQRDVPAALGRSAALAACCYLLPVLALLAVVPAGQVTGIGGFMEAGQRASGPAAGAAVRPVHGLQPGPGEHVPVAFLGVTYGGLRERIAALLRDAGGFGARDGLFHDELNSRRDRGLRRRPGLSPAPGGRRVPPETWDGTVAALNVL